MNAGQYEGLLQVLQEIRDRLPAPERTTVVQAAPPPDNYRGGGLSPLNKRGAGRALVQMVEVAESWARTSAENDEAMGRRNPQPPESQQFVLADIRRMVADVARELGLGEWSER